MLLDLSNLKQYQREQLLLEFGFGSGGNIVHLDFKNIETQTPTIITEWRTLNNLLKLPKYYEYRILKPNSEPWNLIINWLKKQLNAQEVVIVYSFSYGDSNYYIVTESEIRKLNNDECKTI